jgi:hypothetical protein
MYVDRVMQKAERQPAPAQHKAFMQGLFQNEVLVSKHGKMAEINTSS